METTKEERDGWREHTAYEGAEPLSPGDMRRLLDDADECERLLKAIPARARQNGNHSWDGEGHEPVPYLDGIRCDECTAEAMLDALEADEGE
jgi:hypothetical protein